MKKRFLKYTIVWLLATAASTAVFGQKTTLTLSDYLALVRENHPTARQADNLPLFGAAEIFGAKGGFDPKLYGNYENKSFDGKNYFSTGDYGAKMPTRFGTELKVAYTTASGVQLSPENKLPKAGQAVIGFSQPVLQGLLFDERRADLRRARQAREYYAAERQNMLNDLFFQATEAYWKWAFADAQRTIYQDALRAAQQRFRGIVTTYELGERMAMDTLESYIQVQDRQLMLNEANFEFQVASAKLSNFLWGNAVKNALDLQNYAAENPAVAATDAAVLNAENRRAIETQLAAQHPALRAYTAKIAQLETDRRLKLEKRKPKLNLNYNFLGNGANFPVLLTDNYKWGLTFSSPILFRTERADLKLADLKIENTQLYLDQKRLELQNKLRIALADWDNTQTQIALFRSTLNNYQQLLQLENTRFGLGESTFFLINSREMKVIETQVKLIKLLVEAQVSKAAVRWAGGLLAE